MINRLIRAILQSSVIMSWTSLVSRLGMAAIVLPFIVINLSEQDISFWFFLLILNKLKDVFDFGYLDNISRKVSYYKGSCELGAIKQLYSFSYDVYKLNSIYCFFSIFLIAILGLYIKDIFSGNEVIEISLLVFFVAITNSIFILGNRYISVLFGLDYISSIKSWDTLFTLLNIVSLLVVLFYYPVLWALVAVNSFWIILTVIRNRYFCNKIIDELVGIKTIIPDVELGVIKLNSKKDYVASLFSMGYFQLFNYSVSIFSPIGISNAYLLLDNIMEQIKNISRIPFYVNRPKMARDFKFTGELNVFEVRKYMFGSSATLALGIFLFSILGPLLLSVIGSKVSFDLNIWLSMAVFASIERLSAMHNQLYVILGDEVVVHKLLPKTMFMVTILLLIFFYFDFPYYIYPLAFAISYLIAFYPPLARSNFTTFKVSLFHFEVFNLLSYIFLAGFLSLVFYLG